LVNTLLSFVSHYMLRWIKAVPCTFKEVNFDVSLLPLFINWCYNHGIKKQSNHWLTPCYHFYHYVTIATVWLAKNNLNFSYKYLYFNNGMVNFFYYRIFVRRVYKMQLLAKLKKILYKRFRATLNFKVALNTMYRIFLNFAKSCILSCSSKCTG